MEEVEEVVEVVEAEEAEEAEEVPARIEAAAAGAVSVMEAAAEAVVDRNECLTRSANATLRFGRNNRSV